MLTKIDLLSIRNTLMKFIKEELHPIKTDLNALKSDVKVIKKDNTKIRKDISTIADFFDKEYLDLRKRVELIEERLEIVPQN
ncbi:hypothetical protein HY029_00970 [Candidatus Gottesmanbacteria bacterium]|nr:hypothetical protein [Candidatus Gottesmanbacteria bacterium]